MNTKIEITGELVRILAKTELATLEEIEFVRAAIHADALLVRSESVALWLRRNKDTMLALNKWRQDQYQIMNQMRADQCTQMFALLNEALDHQQEDFREDGWVGRQELFEWFTDWRDRVHTLVRTIEGKTASSQTKGEPT